MGPFGNRFNLAEQPAWPNLPYMESTDAALDLGSFITDAISEQNQDFILATFVTTDL